MKEGFYLYGTSNLKEKLPREKQIEYFQELKKGNIEARNILFEHNLLLVASIINNKFFGCDIDEKEDLFQVGSLGLLKAIENFDLSFGYEFSSYAVPMIIGPMYNFKKNNSLIKIGRSMRKLIAEVNKIPDKDKYTIKELADMLERTESDVEAAVRTEYKIISINEYVYETNSNGHNKTLEENLSDVEIDYDNTRTSEIDIIEALNKLDNLERIVVSLKCGYNCNAKTLTEISQLLGLKEDKVRSIYRVGIRKLRIFLAQYSRGYGKNLLPSENIKLRCKKLKKN